jgi:malate synthase
MANERVRIGMLQISKVLFDFVNREVVPGTNIDSVTFWSGVQTILAEFSSDNRSLLHKRDELQMKIDRWHQEHRYDLQTYKSFLFDIGYLTARNQNDSFHIRTTHVDDEIALRAGPQLVVPLTNARFTLNAANARWGSLYDALYGTDVISEDNGCERTTKYNKKRGDQVIAYSRQFLDQTVPLINGFSHADVKVYSVEMADLKVNTNHVCLLFSFMFDIKLVL